MSTRSSIRYVMDENENGFHLFTDFLDDCAGGERIIHLELRGVHFEADSDGNVHIAMPAKWAEGLGLIKAQPPADHAIGYAVGKKRK